MYHGEAPFPFEDGNVIEVRRFSPPPGCWEREDYAIMVDLGGAVAKFLHVRPRVSVGDRIGVGESLGRPIMSSYLRPWSDAHYHMEVLKGAGRSHRFAEPIYLLFPGRDLNPENTFIVEESGKRYALCRPEHGGQPAFLANGLPSVADAGIPHYGLGGLLGRRSGEVLLGEERVGRITAVLSSTSLFTPTGFEVNGSRAGLGFFLNFGFVKVLGIKLSPGDWVRISASGGGGPPSRRG